MRAGAVPDPLSAVTVSADVAAKPTVEFEKPFAVAKTSDKVVAAGSGDVLAKGQTILFDYVLVDGRTGEEVQTSFGQTPASLVLDKKQTATQLVNSLKGETVGSRVLVAIAPKDGLAERLNLTTVKKTRHVAVRDRREVGSHSAGPCRRRSGRPGRRPTRGRARRRTGSRPSRSPRVSPLRRRSCRRC